MKKIKYLLLILGMVFLTSCSSLYPVTSSVDVSFGTYDYNRINYLYMNNYDYFYNNRYINEYGVSCYLYQHPYFIRYSNDYYTRHNTHIPHQRSRYINVRTHRNETYNVTQRPNVVRRQSSYVEPRKSNTVHNRRPYVQPQRSTPVRRSSVQRAPIHDIVERNIRNHTPQQRTTTVKRRN